VTSDYYAVLGVTPTAEAVVISAAYRALIRHYHPDTNPDPDAQAKTREITAAYAVLRDPKKRADYDARRNADEDLWSDEDRGEPVDRPRAPAMRGVGIALAVLALGLVAAVWAWPQSDQTASRSQSAQLSEKSAPGRADPVVDLQPERERLARLGEEAEVLSPPPAIVPAPKETIPANPIRVPHIAGAEPARPRRAMPRHVAATRKPKAVAATTAPKSDRLATLERMSSGFFVQSMANATSARKELLISARERSAAMRKACRSDSCAADTYVRQIRETSAIMEGRTGPPK
jgi:curved DNA-binding protein CbpA